MIGRSASHPLARNGADSGSSRGAGCLPIVTITTPHMWSRRPSVRWVEIIRLGETKSCIISTGLLRRIRPDLLLAVTIPAGRRLSDSSTAPPPR